MYYQYFLNNLITVNIVIWAAWSEAKEWMNTSKLKHFANILIN